MVVCAVSYRFVWISCIGGTCSKHSNVGTSEITDGETMSSRFEKGARVVGRHGYADQDVFFGVVAREVNRGASTGRLLGS
jgi:hypothetical protein